MFNSKETSSLRVRLGKLLNENLSVSWLVMLTALAFAGFVLWAGNTLNSIPLALCGIAIAIVGRKGDRLYCSMTTDDRRCNGCLGNCYSATIIIGRCKTGVVRYGKVTARINIFCAVCRAGDRRVDRV